METGSAIAVDLNAVRSAVEARMGAVIDALIAPANLRDAVRYATLGGGKRLRPVLAWACCEAVGAEGARSVAAGAAVEFVHAFSLVHDDLPALDDDDLRRGRATLHVHAGEAMAILAGDSLLALAFQSLRHDAGMDPAVALRLLDELAPATQAMIAGQVLDTLGGFGASDGDDAARVEAVHRQKTGALIRAACRMGALAGGCDAAQLARVTAYAEAMGLMFQIVDDLLDATGETEHVGKRTGKDEAAGKLTFPGVHGVAGARAAADRALRTALAEAEALGPHAAGLADLARLMARRTS